MVAECPWVFNRPRKTEDHCSFLGKKSRNSASSARGPTSSAKVSYYVSADKNGPKNQIDLPRRPGVDETSLKKSCYSCKTVPFKSTFKQPISFGKRRVDCRSRNVEGDGSPDRSNR